MTVKGWIIEGQATEYNDEYTYALDAYECKSPVYIDKKEAEEALLAMKRDVAREAAIYAETNGLGRNMERGNEALNAYLSAFQIPAEDWREADEIVAQRFVDNPELQLTDEQADAVLALFANIRLTEIEIIPSKKQR